MRLRPKVWHILFWSTQLIIIKARHKDTEANRSISCRLTISPYTDSNSIICLDQFLQNHKYFPSRDRHLFSHQKGVIMGAMTSQITSLTIVYLTVYSVADERKHQSSASLAFVREIHRWPVNSPRKGPVTRKIFPFDDVIMKQKRWHFAHCNHVLINPTRMGLTRLEKWILLISGICVVITG